MAIIDANVISYNLLQFIPRVLEERGIISILYDKCVKFSDPVTRVTSLRGLVLYFDTLRLLCQNNMQLHYVEETGPYEITTRWTMVMKFVLLPWKPELVFTGTSVMGINPKTQKFCSHVDFWDSIEKNDYFSLEGLLDVVRQLRFYKTPELESPKYQILKRTANYEYLFHKIGNVEIISDGAEVYWCQRLKSLFERDHQPLLDLQKITGSEIPSLHGCRTTGDKLSGSTGFNDVAGYIFGKNSAAEKIPMTTPVFTQAFDAEKSKIAIQIVLPMEKDMNSLPNPNQDTLGLRKMEGGIAAVSKFSGKPLEDVVRQKERELRSALIRDGLKPKEGCMLARYNDPGRTWSFIMVR
ncbi:hypothetical protein IFM89_004607 [Coptis chinensis]|uniref:Uncharacterized protein n=1 Tax=Coptis chinensis TaxID=261450 RepID=A0A835H6M8_9MAGN|nr:hypothetical protein IFM89_004607 [Coptis chinensis]